MAARPNVKICGITKKEEAEYLNEASVDYAGFVLFEKSKRYVTCQQAKEIFKKLNEDIIKVAVTVDPDVELLEEVEKAGFDILQVHKNLKPEVGKKCSLPIWYAVNIQKPDELQEQISQLEQQIKDDFCKVKAFVVDAAEYGSGKTFDWHSWDETRWRSCLNDKKFILAGGLNPENVKEGIEIFRPDVVDVSSGVEGDTGKDRETILKFAKCVRENK
ncbi:MAG: phosphoribosylanthranilate isomerase [Roseburia sp.]